MAFSFTQREPLQRTLRTLPAEPMATVLEKLFPVKLTAQWRTPFIDAATKLFTKHLTCATGEEILVLTYNSPKLVTRICFKWQPAMRWDEASATHAADIQTQGASPEERLANTTEEQTTSCTDG